VGNVLVLSSMWALGFTGTYLGKQSKQRWGITDLSFMNRGLFWYPHAKSGDRLPIQRMWRSDVYWLDTVFLGNGVMVR
jgi:hypothetical protein